MSDRNDKVRMIAECAIMIALGTILAQIKIYRMPSGGSVTAGSMVPFLLIAYRCGPKWGLMAGFVNSLLQMLLGGIYPPVAPGALGYAAEILLDYILAYMVLGLAGIFARPFKKNKTAGIAVSAFICCLLRFICAFVSGFAVWADVIHDGLAAITYSLGYNAAYMVPESVVTIIIITVLYKIAPRLFKEK